MANAPCDPTLHELAGQVRELGARMEASERLAGERDRWYSERDRDRTASVDKALTAAKEQTASSFAASKEAILKAEESQKSYNQTHNDLSRKSDELAKSTMPRPESQQRFDALSKELSELKAVVGAGGAMLIGKRESNDDTRANLAIAISIVGAIIVILLRLVGK